MPVTIRAYREPVMGTFLDIAITAVDEATAQVAERAALERAVELAARLTVFDAGSELRRWRRGAVDETSPELTDLLAIAERWQRWSEGAFEPSTAALTDRWLTAERDHVVPDPDELRSLAAAAARPRYTVDGGRVLRLDDCADVDLNAVAKGFVVDRPADAAMAVAGVSRVALNAGGDLCHRGDGSLRVLVEDPLSPYDNGTPIAEVGIRGAAVATSGAARRWFDVGGQRFSRILDPRSGQPCDAIASATVVAPDVATADVLATVCSVWSPDEALTRLDGSAGPDGFVGSDVAVLIVDRDGARHTNLRWDALAAPFC